MQTFKLKVLNGAADKATLNSMKCSHAKHMLNSDGICAVLQDQHGTYYSTKRVKDIGLMMSSSLSESGLKAFNVSKVTFKK